MYSLFNFFLIPPLSFPPYEPFSMQLGTITVPFYFLVTAKFPFAPFNGQDPRMEFERRKKGKYERAEKFVEKMKEIQEKAKAVLGKAQEDKKIC